jgi:hypothetical protein
MADSTALGCEDEDVEVEVVVDEGSADSGVAAAAN